MNNPLQIHSAHNPPVTSYSTCGQESHSSGDLGAEPWFCYRSGTALMKSWRVKLRLSEDAG